jgi:hypothetical protein
MEPNTGVLDPIYVKALSLSDGATSIMFVTIDGVGSDSTLNALAYDIAVTQGRRRIVYYITLLFIIYYYSSSLFLSCVVPFSLLLTP